MASRPVNPVRQLVGREAQLTFRAYAHEAGFSSIEILSIDHDLFRDRLAS